MPMSDLNILISGAGVAGPVLAFWLTRAPGIKCTIVERAPDLRTTGQQIDIRGAARDVIKKMGLEQDIRSKTTGEEGMAFVDSNGNVRAKFGVDNKEGMSFTSDIEILRGELARIFHIATKDKVRYIFGDCVVGIREDSSGVTIDLDKGRSETFDILVAADGLRSKTRRLAFGADESSTYRSLNQYSSFFTIPSIDLEEKWALWYNAPGGRVAMLRPDRAAKSTRSYLSIMGQACRGYEKLSIAEQKVLIQGLFVGAGWKTDTVVKGMLKSEDFYMQEIAQVKMPRWSKGRVVLIGDAGFCPSPISGMGTSLAIVSAYVLAGEISRHRDDLAAAFDTYETALRPFVENAQKLPPGAPRLACPQSSWGIWILYTLLSFVTWSGLDVWLAFFNGPSAAARFKLPEYDM